jgi:tetratricopeptide (TPR) repeat protein
MTATTKDWFRKTTWNEVDQADFFDRLKRSRTVNNKAQYLRIQASHLEKVGSPEMLRSALTLLEIILDEFSTEFELASVYDQKASCLAKLGEIDKALDSYRLAIDTERKHPRMGTRAYISFGRLVVENKLAKLYDEALATLEGPKLKGIDFAANVYEKSGIRAIIAAHKGETEMAKKFAVSALKAAATVHSGFRYHPTVGLVRNKETPFYKSIEAIGRA